MVICVVGGICSGLRMRYGLRVPCGVLEGKDQVAGRKDRAGPAIVMAPVMTWWRIKKPGHQRRPGFH